MLIDGLNLATQLAVFFFPLQILYISNVQHSNRVVHSLIIFFNVRYAYNKLEMKHVVIFGRRTVKGNLLQKIKIKKLFINLTNP